MATVPELMAGRDLVHRIYIDEKVERYIVYLVLATRYPADYGLDELEQMIEYGGSPRATICLTLAAKANALLAGRGYVPPDDVMEIGMDVLRHRVIISYEAEAEELTSEAVIRRIFDTVEVP